MTQPLSSLQSTLTLLILALNSRGLLERDFGCKLSRGSRDESHCPCSGRSLAQASTCHVLPPSPTFVVSRRTRCSLVGKLVERVQNCFLACRVLHCNLPVTLVPALLPGQTPALCKVPMTIPESARGGSSVSPASPICTVSHQLFIPPLSLSRTLP